ncbi:MAG: hypothetical protein JNJ77_07715 [Planctomycetia bacterium]|nr:hypothetical protein [Planctomycetia bacterium]
MLFAAVNWSQAFVYGLIFGGIGLVLSCVVYFIRAMNAPREESKQYENSQSLYVGIMALGICFVVGGLYFRSTLTSTSSNSSDLSSYTEFVSTEGRFKASFPGKPREKSQSVLGMKIKMFTVEESDGTMGVAYLDVPEKNLKTSKQIEESLTNARNGMLKNVNAKLIKEDRITLSGKYPGREIRAEVSSKNIEMYSSIYLVNGRAYQVLIMGKTNWLESDKARKFLNSFALR